MDEKISLEAIAVYADNYSEKVIKAFFQKRDKITGSEILSFSNIQQVNLLIVKELFKSWKEENKKLRSPYFDYENAEVREALDNLMNILSRNISIGQQHFSPVVKKAVSQALLVIFDPYDFYSILITGKTNKLDINTLREEIKYLKVNKAPLEKMLQKMEEKGLQEVTGNEALGILDQILEEVNFTPEDVDEYIEKFSVVSALDPNRFFISQPQENVKATPPPETTPEIPKPVESKPTAPANANATAPKSNVNEAHGRESRPTIANNFQKRRKIKESLTINQKFMFTKVLFHGDFELFTKAVERLDQLDSLPSALRYIEEEHASTWDRDSEEFHEFMELIENRFV
jgi:hypothetical protein